MLVQQLLQFQNVFCFHLAFVFFHAQPEINFAHAKKEKYKIQKSCDAHTRGDSLFSFEQEKKKKKGAYQIKRKERRDGNSCHRHKVQREHVQKNQDSPL